ESGTSNAYPATTLTEPAPTSLMSTAGQTRHGGKTQDSVKLTWANVSTDGDGNHIERCTGSGCTGFSEIAIASATATTYTDNSVATTTTYRYRVRAHSPGGYSTYSNTTTVTTP